ncbi:hypothetical protein AB0B95_30530 [Streptomyces hygroscopicus]|uniref:hypothetical protein n=1 Tax=Streptomyces hygroscopicus TaxID=1912 RepID=UPI00207BB6A9|nr:hypothetical protein [Streptomyces hygroscopicus]
MQALRLARAGGDIEMGAYVLTTMALHTILEGAPDQALDMAQGVFHRGRRHASRRVQAFANWPRPARSPGWGTRPRRALP